MKIKISDFTKINKIEYIFGLFITFTFFSLFRLNSLPLEISKFIDSSFLSNYNLQSLPLGLSELIFLFIIIYSFYFFMYVNKFSVYMGLEIRTVYLVVFLSFLIMLISMMFSLLSLDYKHENIFHNVLAFAYLNLIFFSLVILKPNILNVIKYFYINGSILLVFFLLYSLFSDFFFGYNLYYANTENISLFTKNHHQIGFFSSIIFLLSVFYAFEEKKYINFFVSTFSLLTLYLSNSFGNYFSLLFSILLIFLIFIFRNNFHKLFTKKVLYLLFFLPMCLMILASYSILFKYNFYIFLVEPMKVAFRLQFVSNLIENTNLFNFIFGRGPGGYVYSDYAINSTREVHNSFLDLFMYSGFFALILLILLFVRTIALSINSNIFSLTCLLIFIFLYSFTHNIIRYPFFWIFFLFILTKCNNLKHEHRF